MIRSSVIREQLLTDSEIDQSDLDKIREEIFHEIDSAVEQAKSAPPPLARRSADRRLRLRRIVHQMKRQSIAEALRDAIAEEMERDESRVLYRRRHCGTGRLGRRFYGHAGS